MASYNRYSLRCLLYARSGEGQPQETLPPKVHPQLPILPHYKNGGGEQYVFSTSISAEGRDCVKQLLLQFHILLLMYTYLAINPSNYYKT